MAFRTDIERLSGEVNLLSERATVNKRSVSRLATRLSLINSVLVKDDSLRRVLTPDEAESHQKALREFHSLLEGAKDYLAVFSQDIRKVAPILSRENAKSDFDAFGDRLRRLLPELVLVLSDAQTTGVVEGFSENKMRKEDEEDAEADWGDVENMPVTVPGGVEGQRPGEGNVVASDYGRPVCAAQDTLPIIMLQELDFNPTPENEIKGSERSELGSVYRGKFRNTQGNTQNLAIKKLHVPDGAPHYDRQDSLKSAMDLRGEAEVLMKFQSENVVRLLGICTDPGNYLLVMEYEELGTLRDVLLDSKCDLSWDRRVRMGLEGARGLYTLHHGKTRMLHCDVNTRKFLVDRNMHVKLTGFGLATTRSSARKLGRSSRKGRPSSTRHTVKFVAPERLADINTPYDERAESYSFGIVLNEIAHRQPPFGGMRESDIAEFVKSGGIQDVPADCPAKFRQVIDACRALDPAVRPLSAEIADSLQDAFIQSVNMASDTA